MYYNEHGFVRNSVSDISKIIKSCKIDVNKRDFILKLLSEAIRTFICHRNIASDFIYIKQKGTHNYKLSNKQINMVTFKNNEREKK